MQGGIGPSLLLPGPAGEGFFSPRATLLVDRSWFVKTFVFAPKACRMSPVSTFFSCELLIVPRAGGGCGGRRGRRGRGGGRARSRPSVGLCSALGSLREITYVCGWTWQLNLRAGHCARESDLVSCACSFTHCHN